ncbi:glucose-6-phosphate 1-dehydrogenase [Brucella melitensis]|nr:glucose-6-phosphate 1-dehydrogenase [Brucella melitensis]
MWRGRQVDEGWDALKTLIGKKPEKSEPFYLAVSPTLFRRYRPRGSKAHGLITRDTRIVVEKPMAAISIPPRRSTTRWQCVPPKTRFSA